MEDEKKIDLSEEGLRKRLSEWSIEDESIFKKMAEMVSHYNIRDEKSRIEWIIGGCEGCLGMDETEEKDIKLLYRQLEFLCKYKGKALASAIAWKPSHIYEKNNDEVIRIINVIDQPEVAEMANKHPEESYRMMAALVDVARATRNDSLLKRIAEVSSKYEGKTLDTIMYSIIRIQKPDDREGVMVEALIDTIDKEEVYEEMVKTEGMCLQEAVHRLNSFICFLKVGSLFNFFIPTKK